MRKPTRALSRSSAPETSCTSCKKDQDVTHIGVGFPRSLSGFVRAMFSGWRINLLNRFSDMDTRRPGSLSMGLSIGLSIVSLILSASPRNLKGKACVVLLDNVSFETTARRCSMNCIFESFLETTSSIRPLRYSPAIFYIHSTLRNQATRRKSYHGADGVRVGGEFLSERHMG